MTEAQKIETTYAELRDDDVLVDKSGGHWHVSGVSQYVDVPNGDVGFWLGDARTKVRMHHMTKPAGDACTVLRVPTAADDLVALEAGSALPDPTTGRSTETGAAEEPDPWQTPASDTHDAAVAEVEAQLGGRVEVEATDAEVDAARRATEDEPVVLPLFESMTDLEQRSHLFVLHGVFADDLDDRKTRSDTHTKAHSDRAQGKLKSRHTPHVHSEEAK